jgi:anti-sigma regulatory factor (Ser/Thr protein kinase)
MAAATADEFSFTLEDLEALPRARHELEHWLRPRSGDAEVVSDVLMAATELCANGLRAAQTAAVLRARTQGDSVLVEVVDDGDGIEAEVPEEAPSPMAESGRGLFVVRQLVDVLWIRPSPDGGTCATFARRLTPGA